MTELHTYLGAGMRAAMVFALIVSMAPLLAWLERKSVATLQDRRGPNRAAILGIHLGGLLHSLADALKLLTKTDIVGERTARAPFILASILAFSVPVVAAAVIPFAQPTTAFGYAVALQVADLKAGLLYVLALLSLGIYAQLLAGWASFNTYSLIGSLRAAAQTVSVALPLGLAIAAISLVAGSLSLNDIVAEQGSSPWMWNVIRQPVAFLIFFTALFSGMSRPPCDAPLCESELVAGYQTEYGGTTFGLFLVGEYAYIAVCSLVITAVFLGGWQIPFISANVMRADIATVGIGTDAANIVVFCIQVMATLAKGALCAAVIMWIRWTLPRFRYDQLMRLGWRVMLPLGLANLVATAATMLFISA